MEAERTYKEKFEKVVEVLANIRKELNEQAELYSMTSGTYINILNQIEILDEIEIECDINQDE